MTCKRYKTGGAVRDAILGIKSKDLDWAITAPSYAAMRDYVVNDLKGTIFLEQEQFLTIRAKVDNEAADFVLARKDGTYNTDGRRPDFVEPGTIYDDLARRDFTVNAIAVDEEGNYIDPHGGIKDIERKLIRCVGSATTRFREDSLRLLRAMRFHITKGFKLDKDIEFILVDREFIELLNKISVERIAEELKLCFAYSTYDTLEFLDKYALLRYKLFSVLRNGRITLVPAVEYAK